MSAIICPETKQRLEALENLVHRIASSASASPPFAGPIVPNEAAAQALVGLPDGKEVFVLTHRSIWTKRTGVAGTQGVPPLAPHEVIACTDGTGVLCRTTYSDPALRLGVNFIHIDPANPAANDENTGLTAGAPLKTGRELFRRWGWGAQLEVGPNLATSVDGFLEIRVHSDIVAPDSLDIINLVIPNASLRVRGQVKATLRTSAFTAATVAMNPAAPLGGTRLRLTDAGLATWAPYFATNIRGRITSGVALGGTFQPQMDVPAAPGSVDCSACQTTNEPAFSLTPTTVTPAVGDSYVIEQLVEVNFGILEIGQSISPAFGGINCNVNIVDCNIPSIGFQFNWGPQPTQGTFFNFYQCTFDRPTYISHGANGYTYFIACYFTESPYNTAGGALLFGGGALRLAGSTAIYLGWNGTFFSSIDFNFVAHGMTMLSIGIANVQNAAFWNVGGSAGNPGGHAIIVGEQGLRSSCVFQGLVWGGGSTGAGVRVGSACDGVGAPQNITGILGDLALASQRGLLATCVYWDFPTSTYLPIGGLALSWAILPVAKGAGGYAGAAHNPDENSHWNPIETN